jgi:hypothetical protein
MINSYLGNICPFPLVTRNVKEELNMSTTTNNHQIRLMVGPSNNGRHWLHLCIADALSIQSHFRSVAHTFGDRILSHTILGGGQGKWALCPTTEESLKNALTTDFYVLDLDKTPAFQDARSDTQQISLVLRQNILNNKATN